MNFFKFNSKAHGEVGRCLHHEHFAGWRSIRGGVGTL